MPKNKANNITARSFSEGTDLLTMGMQTIIMVGLAYKVLKCQNSEPLWSEIMALSAMMSKLRFFAQIGQELGVGFGLAQALQDSLGGFNEVAGVRGNHGHHASQQPYLLQTLFVY